MEVLRDRPLTAADSSHRIPYLFLIGPTIFHGFLVDLIFSLDQRLISRLLPRRTRPDDTLGVVVHGLWAAYFSSFLSESLLYPVETVMTRLVYQGMPVLVDDVQTGLNVRLVASFYRGFVSCVTGIWEAEGVFGFFRGYSSLLLRYFLHGGILLVLWRIERAATAKLKATRTTGTGV